MQKNIPRKYLTSVVVPAFKQEKTIVVNIRNIERVLKKLAHRYEIIVVVDGFVDKTFEKAKSIASKNVKVIGYQRNMGKGYTIRYGMVRAKGNIVGFIDAGMDLNPQGLKVLLEKLEKDKMDIIIGSKRHSKSRVTYPFKRKALSILSQLFIRLLFGLNVKDTQVGMKFFRKEVLDTVLPRLLVKYFAFDIEILVVAYYLGFKKIGEAPIQISYRFEESIVSQNLAHAVARTLWDSLAIFYRLRVLRYYDDTSKRKWKYDSELNVRVRTA